MTRRWSLPACLAAVVLLGPLHAQQPEQPVPPLPLPAVPAAPHPLVRRVHTAPGVTAPQPVVPLQPACQLTCAAEAPPCGTACGATCGATLIDPKSTILKTIDAAIGEASLDAGQLLKAHRARVQVAVLLELARLHERHGQIAAADHYLRRILTLVGGEPIDPPPSE